MADVSIGRGDLSEVVSVKKFACTQVVKLASVPLGVRAMPIALTVLGSMVLLVERDVTSY